MASKALSYLIATITQSGADAFTQTTITTGLATDTRFAFRVREMLLEVGATAGGASTGATQSAGFDVALTRKSFAASPSIIERSLIWKRKWFNIMTTSGSFNFDQVKRDVYGENDNILIVEPTIYAQFDSASSSATNVGYLRIGYETVTISDVDRLTLISNSLAS